MIEVLSPVGIPSERAGRLTARISSLTGRTVGLLSNNKNGTEALYAGMERALLAAGIGSVLRWSKPVASVGHADLPGVAASCDVAVVALAD